MKNEKAPLSIRLIYWFTNIVLGLLLVVCLATIVFNVLLYTKYLGEDIQLHMLLPVKVDIEEMGTLKLNGESVDVELVAATPRIHYFNTPEPITKKVGIVVFLVVLWVTFQTWTFRLFINNVRRGEVFSFKNISYLKRLAYAFAGFWLFAVIYFNIAYHYLAKNLVFENLKLTEDIPDYGGVLFIALFTWVLAHIFKTGLELKQETDLTI